MREKHTYYDWLIEQNVSPDQQSKLHILLYLLSDKLTGDLITAEYDRKIRDSVPEFAHILDASTITQELVYSTLESNFQFSKASINKMIEGMRKQGNFAKLTEFMGQP
ncbi:hypothetical protein GOP56_18775 [Brevibacillus sp. 7WMA2]|uniref:hypothetical protein n=1 Tax=Brevibacillus TaxID=55080 RepID=UPI000BC767C7|nr:MULTISPECIES: hypothetical protein [Brevibacillus]MCR8996849.1 hypothetical protein [Brevibacillus laterosporus]PCN42107.1 hypothetical protein B9C88_22590 [Brevibacillus laterosporus]QIC07443.1 hypothetical protein GOP56_18775 [Brevibacillus sp. 7WMA2]WPS88345.1 hypothetical protein SMD22_05055 [Brevibacillus halotolerans]